MIVNFIRAQYGGPPQTSFMYFKPYAKRIDNLRMPLGYQPPKFQQLDRKGNPNTRRVVSIMEFTNTKQRKEESVIDYISRWGSLSLDCQDKLTELSIVEMCTPRHALHVRAAAREATYSTVRMQMTGTSRKVDDPN
ncbi:retrotransposon protein putative ty3-gypsy sub-class [Cucumis melo var. makuwa]|uniref:Retrotransposon protein putative ty3-gypsy sub-class n=1 Tax=Cucumis melo var. makuwa TaxID=1194695 RepID=A0A5A7V5M1_CUCMM|nr:retrotransposon protein putative ty3-gypsy sub-class [Cucumis melo var. makuwa]TYK28766.1 retrotransposon protein putative ty3-gypsy sub-class [Cucumis melo var. makuwa]